MHFPLYCLIAAYLNSMLSSLLVAIDLNHPVNLYVSDLPNGRRTGISVTGKSYGLDGFKVIWSIHLDTLRSRLHDVCPSWYEDQLDKEGKGAIKEVLKFIKDNHPNRLNLSKLIRH